MNFFESQDHARKSTTRLVFFFALAVITLIIMTNLLVMMTFGYLNAEEAITWEAFIQTFDWQTFIAVGIGVSTVVLVGSLYKMMALSGGGKVVAESLGGQLIPQNTQDLSQRKLLNVVEEMAIASGIPVPPVYLLTHEPGINAFAAGFSPKDAVIGITQGAIEQFSREQLQGVIAHEFSHILNGDMRLNIRLMGVLNGILVIGLIGYFIMRSFAYSSRRSSRDSGGGGAMALGIGLMVIGFAGTFFGNLIKASVSRQREFLADASAVQFTRNPQSIAGALKKIGGFSDGSMIDNPGAPEVSHCFFSMGVSNFLGSMMATHPPLEDRIKRIDPRWDGKFDYSIHAADAAETEPVSEKAGLSAKDVAAMGTAAAMGAAVADAMTAVDQIGNPSQATLNYAETLIATLPEAVKQAVHEPYGARAIIYTLLLDEDANIRTKQLAHLQNEADDGVYELTEKLTPDMDALDVQYRLPIIDMALPSLRQLSLGQYQLFKRNVEALIEMDAKIDLFEWSLQKIVLRHLDAEFHKHPLVEGHYIKITKARNECEVLLSLLAYAGHTQEKEVQQAFNAANDALGLGGLKLLPKSEISLVVLNKALDKLARLKPLIKPRLLKACVSCIAADQVIKPKEIELLRAFSDTLDCPMLPLQTFT